MPSTLRWGWVSPGELRELRAVGSLNVPRSPGCHRRLATAHVPEITKCSLLDVKGYWWWAQSYPLPKELRFESNTGDVKNLVATVVFFHN